MDDATEAAERLAAFATLTRQNAYPAHRQRAADIRTVLAALNEARSEGRKAADTALSERVAELEKGLGWRPIDSAPRDGTVIDLFSKGRREPDCYWGKPDHCCGEAGRYCDSDWHSEAPGWVDSTFNHTISTEPTHWRPLPDDPSEREAGT